MDIHKSINELLELVDKSEVTDADISIFKSSMKEVEKVLKEKNKPKTITISGYSHKIVKDYCLENNLNMGEWVSSILVSEIEKSNPDNGGIDSIRRAFRRLQVEFLKDIDMSIDCKFVGSKIFEDEVYKGIVGLQGSELEYNMLSYKEYIKEETRRIEKKYMVRSSSQILNILRCECLINNENLIPLGYSIVDGYAIYEIFDNIDVISNKLYNTVSKYEIKEMSRRAIEQQVTSTSFEDLQSINFDLEVDIKDASIVELRRRSKSK